MIKTILEKIDNKTKASILDGKNIARILNGEKQDGILLFHNVANGGIPGVSYSFKEQFYDKEKMLFSQLEDVLSSANTYCDAPFCVRPNFGTIVIPAIMGCDYEVQENQYPWLKTHLNKSDISSFNIDSINSSEMLERCLDYLSYYRAQLPEHIHLYLPDTQGPYDLAHLVYGDDLFLEMYDDPTFTHHLLDICTDVYIEVTRLLKDVIGEPRDACFHGHASVRGIKMQNGGARISEDSATLISKDQIEEFVLPYDKKALASFGGGFVHYCGNNKALQAAYLSMDEVRAINLGNPEAYDFDELIQSFDDHNKVYFGHFAAIAGESVEAYFKRIKFQKNGTKRRILYRYNSDAFPLADSDIYTLWENIKFN